VSETPQAAAAYAAMAGRSTAAFLRLSIEFNGRQRWCLDGKLGSDS
jgi:hypothetical protein